MTTRVYAMMLVACGCLQPGGDRHGGGAGGKADQISPSDDPNKLFDGASFRLGDNISAADIGHSFGVDDQHIPYPDTYWPYREGGIDWRWVDADTPSPLEKYMSIADPDHAAEGKDWENTRHGPGRPNGVLSWYGHCNGWTAAAMLNAPVAHAAFAKSDGEGGITPCSEGTEGCVKFEIGDINALMAEAYLDGARNLIGANCHTSPSDIERDQYGRIVSNGCQGLNAGALLVVVGNLLKQRHKAFGIDAQNAYNTGQIWNQPAYRYTVYRYERLSEAEAANLVAHGSRDGDLAHYLWNDNAHGWAFVDLGIKWVREHGPNTTFYSGLDSSDETRMVAVIELDSEAGPEATIMGGEYLNDTSVGADRLTVHPYVWLALTPGSEWLPTYLNGSHHNGYLKPSLVQKLVELGQQ